jgi:glutathione S-transferase
LTDVKAARLAPRHLLAPHEADRMTATLHGLSYSPWTERARWALDHHRVPYVWRPHRLYLEERSLRRRARVQPGQRATVPLFVVGDTIVRDSIEIVRHADRVGGGPRLVHDERELAELVEIFEPGLRAMRGRVTAGTLESPACIREHASEVVPSFMAGLLTPVVVRAARFIGDKYDALLERDGRNLDAIGATLRAARARIDTSRVPDARTLRIEHILLATFLQGIRPVNAPHIRLGPASREVWTCTPLLEEARELLTWRDAVYTSARSLPPRAA